MTGDEKIRLAKEITKGTSKGYFTRRSGNNTITYLLYDFTKNSCNVLVHNDQIKIADLGLSKLRNETTGNVLRNMAYIDPQLFKDIALYKTKNLTSTAYFYGSCQVAKFRLKMLRVV